MRKPSKASVVTVAISGAVLAATGTVGAYAAGMIGSAGILDESIRSVDIRDGMGVAEADLRPGLAAKVNKPGPAGPAGADAFVGSDVHTFGAKVLADIGGSWKNDGAGQGHTTLGTVQVPAGTYLLTLEGHVVKSSGLDNGAGPVFTFQASTPAAVNAFPATEFTTAWTGAFPTATGEGAGAIEQTTSSYAVVTLTQATTIEVNAFGYNADRSDAGSGNFSADATLSMVEINAD